MTAREINGLVLADGPRPLRAVVLLEELAEDAVEAHGPRHSGTLSIRQSLAYARLRAGDHAGAVRVYTGIVADLLPLTESSAAALLTAGHRLLDDRALSIGTQRPLVLALYPTLAVGLAQALAGAGRLEAARELLAAVCVGRDAVMGAGHPLAVESRAALDGLGDRPTATTALPSAPDLPLPVQRARRAAVTVGRTAWRPRLTLLDEPGSGATIWFELQLEPDVPGADPRELPDLQLVTAVASDAVIEPAVVAYTPGGGPALFALTPAVAGLHRVRITVYHAGHGAALQDLTAVVDVPQVPRPSRRSDDGEAVREPARPEGGSPLYLPAANRSDRP